MHDHGFTNWSVKDVDQGDSKMARISLLGREMVDFGLFQKFEKFFVQDSPELSLSCHKGDRFKISLMCL
jgi:hypothetical protein